MGEWGWVYSQISRNHHFGSKIWGELNTGAKKLNYRRGKPTMYWTINIFRQVMENDRHPGTPFQGRFKGFKLGIFPFLDSFDFFLITI